jgi:hypothetical protein
MAEMSLDGRAMIPKLKPILEGRLYIKPCFVVYFRRSISILLVLPNPMFVDKIFMNLREVGG